MSTSSAPEDPRDEAVAALRSAEELLLATADGDRGLGLAERLERADARLGAWGRAHPARHDEATALTTRLRAAGLRLRAIEVVRRRDAAERLQHSLRRLQQFESTRDLAAQVPEEVARLGFRRTMFSWVDRARWVPVAFHTESGPEEARAVMGAGEPPYWDLHRLLEGEMVDRRRPILVRNALDNPRVHLDIQAVMHSHSYVAAPVVRRAQVVGFISADQNVDLDVVDELDRDLIQLFAEGLSLALDRVAMLEELADLRQRIGRQASLLSDLVAGGTMPDPLPSEPRPPDVMWRDLLTRREEEVLALVAGGLTNAQIAQRIYVTEGTAKTHVKNLMRKLGAENRAHAGALYRQHWSTPGR